MADKGKLANHIKMKKAALEKQEPVEPTNQVTHQQHQMLNQKQTVQKRIEGKRAVIEAEPEEEVEAAQLPEGIAEEFQTKATELKQQFDDLVERVSLAQIVRETTSLGNQIGDFPEEIARLRQRGYIFHAYLEDKLDVFAEQWDETNERIEAWLDEEQDDLDTDLARAQQLVEKISVTEFNAKHKAIFVKLEGILDTLEQQVEAGEERITALYEELQREVSKTASQLRTLEQYMDWVDDASFELMNGESIYMVAKAEWDDGQKKPDGFIYLTDQRLLFEQKEKVGKRLGMFGGKAVQDILWEAPLSSLEEVKADNRGMLGGKDMVMMTFGGGTSYPSITVEVKGGVPAKLWSTQIRRAARGSIQADSTVEEDPELLERLQNAPTDCPNCGASLPQLTGNMTETACKYCGNVVRV